MSGDTEEKQHQPTDTKLRRARREGNVPHAKDVMALAAWPIIVWLVFNWTSFEASLRRLLANALSHDFNAPVSDIANDIMFAVFWEAFGIVLPIFIVVIIIALVVGLIDNGGFIFAGKPVAPDFNRINPGQGFKRIFSARTAAEAGFSLVKMTIFAGIAALLLTLSLSELRRGQACGFECLPAVWSAVVFPLLWAFLAVFLVAAILDFLMSRQLFRREMKMSHSELKRENKDVYGNPELKQRRKALGQEVASTPTALGLTGSTLLFVGKDAIVGIRYIVNETPAPFITLKATGDRRRELLVEARRLGRPLVRDDALATRLFAEGFVGSVIPRSAFVQVAQQLISRGAA
jgi:type III secretion protein U